MSARKPSAEANLRWNLRRRLNDKQYRAAIRNLRAAKAEAAERAAEALSGTYLRTMRLGLTVDEMRHSEEFIALRGAVIAAIMARPR